MKGRKKGEPQVDYLTHVRERDARLALRRKREREARVKKQLQRVFERALEAECSIYC